MPIYDSIAEAIGNTPLVRLSRINTSAHNLLGKCEFMNPGGSVKDRIAFHLIRQAEADGRLRPGMLLVEATGGNTGIGLAMAARLRGYQLVCVMTEKVGREKVDMMKLLGAETIVVPGGKPESDPQHFINIARGVAEARNGWFVDQFNNRDNLAAHYESTGPELWEQTGGKIDALVAGIGTGGTLLGAGAYLREKNPAIKLILADPRGSRLTALHAGEEIDSEAYLVEGIGGDRFPNIADPTQIDQCIQIDDDLAIATAHELIRKEALFVGGSAGCAVAAALEFARSCPGSGRTIVAILPSTGRLYTRTIYDQNWLAERGKSIAPQAL